MVTSTLVFEADGTVNATPAATATGSTRHRSLPSWTSPQVKSGGGADRATGATALRHASYRTNCNASSTRCRRRSRSLEQHAAANPGAPLSTSSIRCATDAHTCKHAGPHSTVERDGSSGRRSVARARDQRRRPTSSAASSLVALRAAPSSSVEKSRFDATPTPRSADEVGGALHDATPETSASPSSRRLQPARPREASPARDPAAAGALAPPTRTRPGRRAETGRVTELAEQQLYAPREQISCNIGRRRQASLSREDTKVAALEFYAHAARVAHGAATAARPLSAELRRCSSMSLRAVTSSFNVRSAPSCAPLRDAPRVAHLRARASARNVRPVLRAPAPDRPARARDLADRFEPERAQRTVVFGPAPQRLATGSGASQARASRGWHDRQPVGFAKAARDLCDVLRPRHSHRRGESAGRFAHRVLELAADGLGRAEQAFAARHVEKRFIQAQRLDLGEKSREQFMMSPTLL